MSPRQPSSTSAIMITCPATEYSVAMSTTVSPVTHTAEHAVKSAVPKCPAAPSARENGHARSAAPTTISERKPSANDERVLTA